MRACLYVFAALFVVGCGEPEAVVETPVDVPQEQGFDASDFGWETPFTAETLGEDPGELEGESLSSVVNSHVAARNGYACAACHFEGTVTFYAPENEAVVEDVGPYDIVDGRTWAGNYGWGARLVITDDSGFADKPPVLRRALELFLAAEAERVEPLTWEAPINAERLGQQPRAAIDGVRLYDVINSRVAAREDGLTCSTCHYQDGPYPYRPEVAPGQADTVFGPDAVVDGRSWAEPGGWADVFVALGPDATAHKPDYLRSMFFKWTDDGAR